MQAVEAKVEIEALYCRGFESLSTFLQHKILHAEDMDEEAHLAVGADDGGGSSGGQSAATDVALGHSGSQGAWQLGAAEDDDEEDWLLDAPPDEWDW